MLPKLSLWQANSHRVRDDFKVRFRDGDNSESKRISPILLVANKIKPVDEWPCRSRTDIEEGDIPARRHKAVAHVEWVPVPIVDATNCREQGGALDPSCRGTAGKIHPRCPCAHDRETRCRSSSASCHRYQHAHLRMAPEPACAISRGSLSASQAATPPNSSFTR